MAVPYSYDMGVEKRGVQYLKSVRISGQLYYGRAKSWWASIIDKQDSRIQFPLLVLGDMIGWALLLVGGACLVGFGVLALVLVFGVLLFPFYFLTLYLGWNNLSNSNTLFYGLGQLAVGNAVLIYILWWLRMPESEDLRRKYGIDKEQSPEKIIERFQIISLLLLWLGGSAYAAVFCLDLLVVSSGFVYTVYFALYSCYSFLWFLVNTIPLYIIFPATLFTPLMFISLYIRMYSEVGIPKGIRDKPSFEHPSIDYAPVPPGRLPV